MARNQVAHPLLISLVVIVMDFQMKLSHHAFMLLAILPVPKFLHKNRKIHGVLENCLIHRCINFVVEPLKIATEIRNMMLDPLSWHQYCFTPLVGAIMSTPEALMYAGISLRASSITMTTYKQFSNVFQHKPWTASATLIQLMEIGVTIDPSSWDFSLYLPEEKQFNCNNVHHIFYYTAKALSNNLITESSTFGWFLNRIIL